MVTGTTTLFQTKGSMPSSNQRAGPVLVSHRARKGMPSSFRKENTMVTLSLFQLLRMKGRTAPTRTIITP